MFSFKSSLVMFEKSAILCRFLSFLHLLSKPFVSYVGLFLLLVLFFLAFFLLLVVVWQIKLLCSGSCFCCFGFPWFGYVLYVLFFLLVFGLGCFFGWFKGQVRWPKGPPQLAPNPLYLFCFVFGCFVLVVGFCLFFGFCFCFIWQGFRVKWGGPLGHLTWPLNPP